MGITQKLGLTRREANRISPPLQIESKELEEFWLFGLYTPAFPSYYEPVAERL